MLRLSIIALLTLLLAACDTTLPEAHVHAFKIESLDIPLADTFIVADPFGPIIYDQETY